MRHVIKMMVMLTRTLPIGHFYESIQIFSQTILFLIFRYKQSISKLKDIAFDPIISGPENAVWWTEYVIRHRGARHLRSSAVGVTFAKYFMLDLVSYVVAAACLALFLAYIMLRSVIKRLQARFFGRSEEGGKFKVL